MAKWTSASKNKQLRNTFYWLLLNPNLTTLSKKIQRNEKPQDFQNSVKEKVDFAVKSVAFSKNSVGILINYFPVGLFYK